MSKHLQLALVLTACAAVVIGYLAFSSRVVTVDRRPDGSAGTDRAVAPLSVDQQALAAAYEENLTASFAELDAVLAAADAATVAGLTATASPAAAIASSTATERLAALKVRVMNLTVPAQYRDLHLDVVVSLGKLKGYLANGDDRERVAGIALLEQARRDHDWLRRN